MFITNYVRFGIMKVRWNILLITFLVFIWELRSLCDSKDLQSKGKFPTESMDISNFDKLASTKTFVDKTMMIKEVFALPYHTNLILAPRKFGKSSNINMIRRFCEIEVDDKGVPKDKTSVTAFNIFKTRNLEIFKDEIFVNEHFSSYPVLYLDYSSLKQIDSYEHLIEKLTIIISRAFLEHQYTLANESLWGGFDKGLFQSYVNAHANHKEHNSHILMSLNWLCEVLHKHFGRKVLVLIDDFDAYVYSAIFKDSKGVDKILKLMIEIDGNLLKTNAHVSKVILTGSLKVFRQDINKTMWTYHFLEDHCFSEYFGLTRVNLDNMLSKIVNNCGEKYELLNYIMGNFGNYKIYRGDGSETEVYNMWPSISYALSRECPADYYVEPDHLHGFRTLFKAQHIKEEIQALILGDAVSLDRFAPFTEEDIRTLNYVVKAYICPPSGVEVFLRLLYSLGYLVPVKGDAQHSSATFKIPNNETYNELMRYTPC